MEKEGKLGTSLSNFRLLTNGMIVRHSSGQCLCQNNK